MSKTISKLNILIKKGHLDEAAKILGNFHQLPEEDQQQIMKILALASNDTALALLEILLSNQNLDDDDKEPMFQLVIDRAHIHAPFVMLLLEFAPYIMINCSVPLIRHILSQETNADLLGRVIYTAGAKKINALTQDLAEYTFYGEPHLKSLAIQALGNIGSPDALERLGQIAATEKCDQEVLDAIDSLESEIPAISRQVSKLDLDSLFSKKDEKLLKDLGSSNPQKQFQAFRYFAQSGAKVFQAISRVDENGDTALRIILLSLVAMTTPPQAIKLLLKILTNEKPSTSLKFAVYNALQAYPDIMGSAALIKGALDSASHVRIAAIKALNNHCTDFIIAEIQKKIESGTITGENLAISIVDARAVNMIEKLICSDSFIFIASHHLETSASILVIDSFINALEKHGMKSGDKRYKSIRQQRVKKNLPEIMMINPSMACLDACAQRISQSGYEPVLVQSPQSAFEMLMEKKPAAIIMEVFLQDMHCTDFISEVRKLYKKDELPIIVSSIMDVDTKKWQKDSGHTEAVTWCSFPPRVSHITTWISNSK